MRDEIEDLYHEDEADGRDELGLENLNEAVDRAQRHEEASLDAHTRRIAQVPWRDTDDMEPLDELLHRQQGPRRNRFVRLPRW